MADFHDSRLGLRLLGGFAVNVAGEPVPDAAWRLRRAKSLVKLLALAPERRLHRDRVLEWLWPDGDPATGGLHQVLYTARRALESADADSAIGLTLKDDVVALTGDGIWVDVDAFEQAAAEARAKSTVAAYRSALELYGGELLPEDRYEEWTSARRESLRETFLGMLVELAALLGDTAAAVEVLQRAVVEDPLYEAAHRALMSAFAKAGRRQQALAQYQQLRQALERELAADPDPQTTSLYREILAAQHEPGSAEGAQPTDTAPAQAPHRSHHLPAQLTSFVGRDRELLELQRELDRTRLLTLTGPGGAGKTRLALELAAQRCDDFESGVRLVELAPVQDPALVVEETAAELGVQLRSERDPAEVIAEQVADQHLLLVLDNCEHVIDTCARLADRLLRACPNLHVLATSRERLRIDGEVAWRVPPLSLPESGGYQEPASLERFEAVRLFTRRAADASPGFALTAGNAQAVADICRGLDGMPLALELAAARTAALSPEQIAERLGDALALLRGGSRAGLTRQQTLRATLAWSHDLLSEQEQILYRRLGVFAGSFGVEALEGICADDRLSAYDALDLLVRLVDKSLVQVEAAIGGHRYRLLETVRQDARERLTGAGERERLEAAHRAWYLALAESADRDVHPEVAGDWPPSRLDVEYDNLRAALASAIRNDPQQALALASAMWWFWMARGFFVEGSRWLSEALPGAPQATASRARALLANAAIHVRRRRPLETVPLATESLEVARRLGDRHAAARALERLGVMGMGGFEWPVADEAFEAGLALAEELGDEAVTVAIKHDKGVLAGCRADFGTARVLLQDCLEMLENIPLERGPLFWAMHISPVIFPEGPAGAPRSYFEDTFCLFRSVRSRAATAYAHVNLGEAWRGETNYTAARESLENALELFREIRDVEGEGVALNALGNLGRASGDFDAARECFGEAYALREATGDPREIATTLTGMGMLALWSGDEGGRDLLDQAMRIYERTEDGPGLQGVPLNLGGYELDFGDPAKARVLFEQCIASCREQSFDRNRGFAALQLAEATMRTGEYAVARAAIDEARASLQRGGLEMGLRYLPVLEERLGALGAAG